MAAAARYILEKTTHKVLAFTFGRRTNATFQKLISLLPSGLIDRLDTDDWKSYTSVRFTPIHRIGKDLTWRIERKNLDLRTRIKRLARRTIARRPGCFSKSEQIHDAVIGGHRVVDSLICISSKNYFNPLPKVLMDFKNQALKLWNHHVR